MDRAPVRFDVNEIQRLISASVPKSGGRVRLGGVYQAQLFAPKRRLNGSIIHKDKVEIVGGKRRIVKVADADFQSMKWEDGGHNLVVNEGLQHILDILYLSATAQVDPWYCLIMNGTPSVAAGDTMSSHAGWTENQNYSEAVRQTYTDVRTAQSVDNSAAKATYSIDTDTQTIGGAALCSVSTKGGTTGTLLSGAAFTGGNKSADNGDTLQVTYTFTAADDGV